MNRKHILQAEEDINRVRELEKLRRIVKKARNFNKNSTEDKEIYPLLGEVSNFIDAATNTNVRNDACEFRRLLSQCVSCSDKHSDSSFETLAAFCKKF